ncbi:hypothetical protein [Actinopolyspora mortivallis]|uniref:hypothetical protein n=1 Tax=Actinopolyspora mortivallis TaxID=33906 RepID=UPI00036224FB|nr:hypothetical protein [Actinopolyspora mortivallis]
MTDSADFTTRFHEFLVRRGEEKIYDPEDALSDWQNFVALCEEGYDDNEFEYAFDLQNRDLLEDALNDPRLNSFPEIEWLRREVAEADQRLRAILHEQPIRIPRTPPLVARLRTPLRRRRSSPRTCTKHMA